jgi:hypothetical protein
VNVSASFDKHRPVADPRVSSIFRGWNATIYPQGCLFRHAGWLVGSWVRVAFCRRLFHKRGRGAVSSVAKMCQNMPSGWFVGCLSRSADG